MTAAPAPAKINLALLVGVRRADGLHDVATVLQRIDLCDRIELVEDEGLVVEGYAADTIVRSALTRLADAAGEEPRWRVRIEKRIPVAAGLGGGSADAAVALRLANARLRSPLPEAELAELAAATGSDVPFFLMSGPALGEGAGERLTPLDLPQDYWVVLVLPRGARKQSTEAVYASFDELGGGDRFDERRAELVAALGRCRRPRDFATLPGNDLAAAAGFPAAGDELRAAGAFRADLAGAGPAVYGLFHRRVDAEAAARRCRPFGRVWATAPVW